MALETERLLSNIEKLPEVPRTQPQPEPVRRTAGARAAAGRDMLAVADRADHVLLGTATPIQTQAEDLWDLVPLLHRGSGRWGSGGFVLGNELAPWHNPGCVLLILGGEERVDDLDYGWQLLRSPLPTMESTSFFQRENPLVRPVVLRKRTTLEERGLSDKIAVDGHPEVTDPHRFNALLQGIALRTEPPPFASPVSSSRL